MLIWKQACLKASADCEGVSLLIKRLPRTSKQTKEPTMYTPGMHLYILFYHCHEGTCRRKEPTMDPEGSQCIQRNYTLGIQRESLDFRGSHLTQKESKLFEKEEEHNHH
jgi:hypothetical protein